MLPFARRIRFRRDDRLETQLPCRKARLEVCISLVHKEGEYRILLAGRLKQKPPRRSVMLFPARQCEAFKERVANRQGMDFGVPPSARPPYGLAAVFFKQPKASGCTFTDVESRAYASA